MEVNGWFAIYSSRSRRRAKAKKCMSDLQCSGDAGVHRLQIMPFTKEKTKYSVILFRFNCCYEAQAVAHVYLRILNELPARR